MGVFVWWQTPHPYGFNFLGAENEKLPRNRWF